MRLCAGIVELKRYTRKRVFDVTLNGLIFHWWLRMKCFTTHQPDGIYTMSLHAFVTVSRSPQQVDVLKRMQSMI
jgi:hypothetical protein